MTITREEAIQILSTRDAHGVLCGYTSGVTEALDMAIEALQASTNGDSISRAEAIEMFHKKCDKEGMLGRYDIQWTLETLPSADRPTVNNKVHLCDSCTHSYPDCSAKGHDVLFGNGKGNDNICCCNQYEAVGRPTGKWILVCDGGGECDNLYRCSHCGQEIGCEEYDKPKFCGECGADMREDNNE